MAVSYKRLWKLLVDKEMRDKWTGECSNLMNTVLRDEWGFRGMALTDFFRNNGHGFMN